MQKGLRQAQAQLTGFKRIGEGMASFGASMSKYVTLPILVAGAASAKFAIDFQGQMEMIHTQAGASQREVDKLTGKVLDLAKALPQGPDELAKGLYHLESVGLRGAKAMDVLKVAALGAATGQSDLEGTTNALAGAIVTGIKGTGNYRRAMGVLNATVGAGNMRMDDLASSLRSGVLPAARTAGLGLQDVTAALALLSDEAVPPTVAATRLRMSFSLLAAPSKAAEKQLESIGLTGTKLATAMRSKQGLIGALTLLKDHMKGLSAVKQEQLLSHAFGGGRSGGTIMSLINNLDRLRRKYKQIGDTAGHFNKDVAATQQTAAYKLKTAWSSLQVALIKAGAVIVPVFVTIAQKVASLADAFSRLSPAAQHWVVIALAIVATVGPILFMFGKMIVLGYQVATVLEAIGASGLIAFGWAALIIAVVAALVIAYEKVGWFHHAVNVAFHAIEAVVRAVVGFIGRYWKVTLEVMLAPLLVFVGLVINHWNGIKNAAAAAWGFIRDHWRALVATFIPVLGPVIVAIVDHWNTVKSAASKVWSAISTAIGYVVDKLKAVVSWIGKIHWPSPPGWVKDIAGGVAGGVSSAWHSGTSILGATGGIVTRPTMATIGEAGPEAVIPLNRAPGARPLPTGGVHNGGITVVVQNPTFLTGDRRAARDLARLLQPELNRIITAR